jgi:5S rRNA maturation endonuclease (ribonuclease M5)
LKKYKPIYLSRDQLENVLAQAGVKIVTETSQDLLCYCPFHHNVDSPAFNISKRSPFLWKCWNGKCAKSGNIFSLLTQKGYTPNEARRTIFSGVTTLDDFEELMQDLLSEPEEEENAWSGFNYMKFIEEDREHDHRARDYAYGRGITESAFNFFRMGYSYSKDMLVIPVWDDKGEMLGVIGRSIEGKQYRYSSGLQRGRTIFNIDHALSHGPEIILTEGSLDSIYIWQAGFNCVGAVLGSAISPEQWGLLQKHFTDIVCFFDNDDAGIALTHSVIKNAQGMGVTVVEYPDDRGVKDPGDLSSEEIRQMIDNRVDAITILLGE